MAGGATALKVAGSAGSFQPNESRREGNLGSSSQAGEKTGLTGRLGNLCVPTVCPSGRHRTFRIRGLCLDDLVLAMDVCSARCVCDGWRARCRAVGMSRRRSCGQSWRSGVSDTSSGVTVARAVRGGRMRTVHRSVNTVADIVGASASSRQPRVSVHREVVCGTERGAAL